MNDRQIIICGQRDRFNTHDSTILITLEPISKIQIPDRLTDRVSSTVGVMDEEGIKKSKNIFPIPGFYTKERKRE